MAADREGLSVWRYLFSLRGRVSRRGVWLFVVLFEALMWGTSWLLLSEVRNGATGATQTGLSLMFLGLVGVATLWSRFAILFKRLHDIGRTGLFALPMFLSPILGASHALWQFVSLGRMGHVPPTGEQAFSYASGGVLAYYIVLVLVLGLVPGKTAHNRYAASEPVNISSVF